MGGHGGLNILPQKRWNVYNFDNREKVRKDEEEAAKEEQLKQEQARKRDTEFRLEQLRAARGLAPIKKPAESTAEPAEAISEPVQVKAKSSHINLFEGIKIFDPVKSSKREGDVERDGFKKNKKVKKEEVRVVAPEDEKYRLGYGIAGKGVKLPWYLKKPNDDANDESGGDDRLSKGAKEEGKKSGKKTLEELREERLKRERKEKEREHALIQEKRRRERDLERDRRFSRR